MVISLHKKPVKWESVCMCVCMFPYSVTRKYSKVCLSYEVAKNSSSMQTKQVQNENWKWLKSQILLCSSHPEPLSPSPVAPAMRSGTGVSVVNGRWAVDPPGEYQAGGTTFTYTRPRAQAEGEEAKGESLTAPGPTTTQLQLYVSTICKDCRKALILTLQTSMNPGLVILS